MGTNYYHSDNPCPHCGRGDEALHIGKSSAGWCFSLNTHPEEGIESLDDWKARWTEKSIRDEYGDPVSPDTMLRIITDRHRPARHAFDPEWLRSNDAIPGPNNLARHQIDGRFCIAHGDGTFDIMRCEFS